MNNYLIITALYRFICGGLILAINWELTSPESTSDLAISTILSFVPAIFTPFLINLFFKNCSGSNLTKLSFLGLFLIVLAITLFYQIKLLLILLNFILWIVFFLLETSLEFWFSELVAHKSEAFINKYSSLSMTLNQVALMIGPLFITFIMKWMTLHWIFLIYGIVYILLYLRINKVNFVRHDDTYENAITSKESVKSIHYLIGMLMWPILGTTNFMLPTFIAYKNGKIHEVAILDSALGVGMALIGILLSKYLSYKWINIFLLTSVSIPLLWYYFEGTLIIKLLLMLLFGLSFGGARIIFRKIIVTVYASHTVKNVYSLGNALGLPILSICIYLGMLNLDFVWLPSFFLLIILLALLKTQYQKGTL